MTAKKVAAKKVPVAEIPVEPVISEADIQAMRSAEAITVDALAAEPLETVWVPGNLAASGVLEVRVNGVAFSYPQHREYEMPASIAAMVRARIEGVPEADRK
jgi:hypothetical protein